MNARVMRKAVLIGLTGLALTGCGRQVSKDPSWDPDLLATGPDLRPVPQPFITASIDAAGGLATWTQCRKLDFEAVVTARQPDNGFYLTEHQFSLYPWSDAIRVTAREPGHPVTWRIVSGRYTFEGDPSTDVSPLRDAYREYAEAVLQIVTAPTRVLDPHVVLARRPIPVQYYGQWYQPIDARYQPRGVPSGGKGLLLEPYWTQGTYFQNQNTLLLDLIWLGNPLSREFLLVRGYDYAQTANGVLIPTKIEVFHSNGDAQFGPRLALIDLKE